jgi:hypothetical protein
MVETATLLSAADVYPAVRLPGRKFPAVVVQGDSWIVMLAQLSGYRLLHTMAKPRLTPKSKIFCGLFAEINRKFVSACENRAIELRYPQNGRRVDTLERES